MSDKKKRYMLPEEEIPHYWYNIQADMVNKPMPPLHPGTKQPLNCLLYTSPSRRDITGYRMPWSA